MNHRLRAEAEVRLLVGREQDRLLQAAVSAADASPGWGPGEEFCYEIEDPAFTEEGFEGSAFVVRHCRTVYEITLYDGFGPQFVQ